MDWKKLLPEGPFVLIGLIAFLVGGYEVVAQNVGQFIGWVVFSGIGAYASYRLYNKLKKPTV